MATNVARSLAPNATLITYGGMSKQPLTLPPELVTERGLKLEGFWISDWFEKTSLEKREEMLAELGQLIVDEKLTFFYEMHDLDDFAYALEKSTEAYRLRKVVLNCDYPDRMAEHDALPESAYEIFQGSQY